MSRLPAFRQTVPVLASALAVAIVAVALGGCGSSSGTPEKGLLISGAGIRTTAPPWPIEYQGMHQRMERLGLPKGGSEKFHTHALLSIYNQGLYVTVPGHIGISQQGQVFSSLHTHDPTGIIHMESPRPFRFTLGDLFAEWGVRFGAGTLGSLKDSGSNRVWVYVNGQLITNPAAHVLANNDDISIGYGTQNSFPHHPDTSLLKEIEKGGSALPCAASTGKKKAKSCTAAG